MRAIIPIKIMDSMVTAVINTFSYHSCFVMISIIAVQLESLRIFLVMKGSLMDEIESIARNMALYAKHPEMQVIQTRLRKQIVDAWDIQQGARILEIGCGQGDLTAVLAHAVGPKGHITACDPASPDYGAPITLGESTDYLRRSSLGSRITFNLSYDILVEENAFPSDAFDYVVLAHCSWYFDSLDRLRQTLTRIQPWAKSLCFSEWDLVPRHPSQLAHMLAVLIQGQVEAFQVNSSANIRTPYTKAIFEGLLMQTGWDEIKASSIDSSALQDAQWEMDECLATSINRAVELGLPPRFVQLLQTELSLMQKTAANSGSKSLSSFAILARKLR